MATSWSSGCLGPTPTSRRSPHVKPPSIVPSLVSTAAAAAACLSSAGPCPFLSSCLFRAGPGWPPDPPLPQAPCLCPRPWASGKAFASLLGGDVASLSLCLRRLWLGGRSLAPVCASWFSLALSLSLSLSLSFVEHCVVTAGQSKTQKINKKCDVKRISKWQGEQVFIGVSWDVPKSRSRVRGPLCIWRPCFARASCVLSWVTTPEMQLRFFLFVAHCHCGEKQVWK